MEVTISVIKKFIILYLFIDIIAYKFLNIKRNFKEIKIKDEGIEE